MKQVGGSPLDVTMVHEKSRKDKIIRGRVIT